MRRRSDRIKSASPAPLPSPLPARRSRRSRKISDNDKTEDESVMQRNDESNVAAEINEERASSKERSMSPVRKSRNSRTTPKKRSGGSGSQRDKSDINAIPEEQENGTESDATQANNNNSVEIEAERTASTPALTESDSNRVEKEEVKPKDYEGDKDEEDNGIRDEGQQLVQPGAEEVKVPSPSISYTANKDEEHLKTSSDVLDIQTEDVEERDDGAGGAAAPAAEARETPRDDRKGERDRKKHKEQKVDEQIPKETQLHKSDEHKENRKECKPQDQQEISGEVLSNDKAESTSRSIRKRKWISKKATERTAPVLAISTDSLKNIIADVVQPVPLSDVQLESSSEEEGLVTSDHESGERSMTPEIVVRPAQVDGAKVPILVKQSSEDQLKESVTNNIPPSRSGSSSKIAAAPAPHVARSPSPARNSASHVLFITNLVRPFTVLQLKGLLARTGKIVEENGFWIDRIKSKCYVAYTTEDEAIETRHALHGVRWPVSNPKCLNVDFGKRSDMDRAIDSTKDDTSKFAQDNTRDNQTSGNTWSRLDAGEKKPARPVREWDVGKKEPNERDNLVNERRRGSKDRVSSRTRDGERSSGGAERGTQERKRSKERERERDRAGRERGEHAHGRSRSGSPASKIKKRENEPPIRLLDDLFRKTKAAPCIYWLPLTPEAIAEKEAFRQKRIEEHKQRVKERELERQKEREREKERDRQRETRRNRSTERRRTRSRERRRY